MLKLTQSIKNINLFKSVEITNKMQPYNRIYYSKVSIITLVISADSYYDARTHRC